MWVLQFQYWPGFKEQGPTEGSACHTDPWTSWKHKPVWLSAVVYGTITLFLDPVTKWTNFQIMSLCPYSMAVWQQGKESEDKVCVPHSCLWGKHEAIACNCLAKLIANMGNRGIEALGKSANQVTPICQRWKINLSTHQSIIYHGLSHRGSQGVWSLNPSCHWLKGRVQPEHTTMHTYMLTYRWLKIIT